VLKFVAGPLAFAFSAMLIQSARAATVSGPLSLSMAMGWSRPSAARAGQRLSN
jgi:hypothetical protein